MNLDPFSDLYCLNPSAAWRRLLAGEESVSYDDALEMWLICGRRLAGIVLADSRRFSSATTLTPIHPLHPQAAAALGGLGAPPVASITDPPAHFRSRATLTSVLANTASGAEQRWGPLVP